MCCFLKSGVKRTEGRFGLGVKIEGEEVEASGSSFKPEFSVCFYWVSFRLFFFVFNYFNFALIVLFCLTNKTIGYFGTTHLAI